MTRRGYPISLVFSCSLLLAVLSGCSEDMYTGSMERNAKPVVYLTCGPYDGDETEYIVHFFWYGNDPDGAVVYYEYALTSGDPIGFNPADTTGIERWTKITRTDTVFILGADELDSDVIINNSLYTKYKKTHTFFIRAVDDRGQRSDPVYRSFTAWTLAPFAFITQPAMVNPGKDAQNLAPIIRFGWRGKDPIDSPWNYQDVDSVRYLWAPYFPGIVDDMNLHPEKYEPMWSPWIAFSAPGDSGTTTVLGDDEFLEIMKSYIFAIQAKDEAGAVTSIFDTKTNVRYFLVREPTGPMLIITEDFLRDFRFIGVLVSPKAVYMPSGYSLRFSWKADASEYGSVVSSYRYGWDITNLDDPKEWAVDPGLQHLRAPERSFHSGTHTFYVEAVDNLGVKTIGQIEIQIFQIMERDLLWVDDFYSTNFVQSYYAFPTEQEHDEFWLSILNRVRDFQADRDIYDTAENRFITPDMRYLWKYKNVIWTYCSVKPEKNVWYRIIRFFTYQKGLPNIYHTMNLLSAYMSTGGHLWTLGKSDGDGGIGATFLGSRMTIPRNLRCECTGTQQGCPDTTGALSMGYRDYCITVLDRAWGQLRSDIDFAGYTNRDLDWDGMTHGYKDGTDAVTALHPDLPDELHLWEAVTLPTRYFYPPDRGFHYYEVYDPAYWMTRKGLHGQSCFHPMYRLRTRNTNSSVDRATFAFWTTKYAHVVADAPGAIAAPSVQFGLPLWFFDRDQVNAIADEIFRTWGIATQ